MNRSAFRNIARLALCALTLLLALLPGLPAQPQARAEELGPASGFQLFLPVSTNGKTGQNPPPKPFAGGVFLTRDPQTASADIAIDARGGMHAAYAGYIGYGSVSHGYYFFCGAQAACADPKNWTGIVFGATKEDYIVKAELELTAAGQPRLLLYNDYNGRVYSYAACDADCTNPARWTVTDITRVQSHVDTDTFDYSYHSFELDPQGRPRFIYEDHYGSIHNGLYYVYSDADCSDNTNWYEENIKGSTILPRAKRV